MRTWTQELECKTHGTYEFSCNCTDPDWCDCDECPACQEEDRAVAAVEGLRKQMREEPQ